VGIAKQNPFNSFGGEHYNSTSRTEDNLRPEFAALDTSKHISYQAPDDPDKPDDSETGGGGGGGDDPIVPDDDDDEDNTEFNQFINDNKVLVIVAGSAAIFLIISLLTCCCCCSKKQRKDTYIYRTYSQLRGNSVEALDDDTPGKGTRI
jgi:hypothetical protein